MTVKKMFLVPTALIIGGLMNVNAASAANIPIETKHELNQVSSSENKIKNLLPVSNDLSGLILTNGDSGIVSLSHSSHRSHASHASHRSHYSSR